MNAVTARMHYFPARVRHACIAFGCLLIPLTLLAGSEDLSHLQVSESGGVYSISLVMHMQVPADHVYQVLTDYEHIYRLDPAIVDSEILPAPDDSVVRVRTRINDCIAFFCMTIDRVEDVVRQAQGALQARIVAPLSNFKSGFAEWKIQSAGDRTRVIYRAQMEPDFFIPPLLGSYFVRQKLRQHLLASVERIECIARIQAGLEPGFDQDQHLPGNRGDERAAAVALLAGEDPARVARPPMAGGAVGGDVGCTRPCRSRGNKACRP